MELHQAIDLIHPPLPQPNPAVWADLGCGSGLFTHALAALLIHPATLYAVDKNPVFLPKRPVPAHTTIRERQLDFVKDELDLPVLDGILMANSLHFVADKKALIQQLKAHLKPNGGFLLVEYDTDTPNPWVPHPVSFQSLTKLAQETGFLSVNRINERPSAYGHSKLYAAYLTT
ncbi:class I SAM-dependent methyltransferase [Larkinella ripae]